MSQKANVFFSFPIISELMLRLFLKPSQSSNLTIMDSKLVNRKKKRAFFKDMLTIKQINEEFDKKEREILEEMEVSGMNLQFVITI